MKNPISLPQWQKVAETKLAEILKHARKIPGLAKKGPKTSWSVNVQMVNGPTMKRLNSAYRGKKYITDVLSFPAMGVFREQGILGEIVICLPKLKSQAKDLGHLSLLELEVLLVHGVLHLLGFDHEKGPAEAVLMGRWEQKLLKATSPKAYSKKLSGLIDRAESGIDEE